jgi:hypothetical protein
MAISIAVSVGWAGIAAAACSEPSGSNDAYVTASVKLLIKDTIAANGKAKLVYLSKDKFDPDGDGECANNGGGTDASLMSGTLEVFYRNDPANVATFDLPSSAFITQKPFTVVKYVNASAPNVTGGIKVAVVKTSAGVTKVVAKSLGDSTAIDLFAGGEPGPLGMSALLTLNNGNDSQTYRMCTTFESGSPVVKDIAGGLGRKLLMKQPVEDPGKFGFSDCLASPSGAFLD